MSQTPRKGLLLEGFKLNPVEAAPRQDAKVMDWEQAVPALARSTHPSPREPCANLTRPGPPDTWRQRRSAEIEKARNRTRTDDPFLTMEVLYQLSYPGRLGDLAEAPSRVPDVRDLPGFCGVESPLRHHHRWERPSSVPIDPEPTQAATGVRTSSPAPSGGAVACSRVLRPGSARRQIFLTTLPNCLPSGPTL